mmetsp:Transcript_11188/g.26570  ORF Transcript_11188/g.26570 Transcript_11188/m.26570 type:complete len:118 (-) Transcript_11188:95-448(-)
MGDRSARCRSRAHDRSPHRLPSRGGASTCSACSATTALLTITPISTSGAIFALALGPATARAITVAASDTATTTLGVRAFELTAATVTIAAAVTIATPATTIAAATVVTATVCYCAG